MSDRVDAAREKAQTYLFRVRNEGLEPGWMALLSAAMKSIDDYAYDTAQEVRDAAVDLLLDETAKS